MQSRALAKVLPETRQIFARNTSQLRKLRKIVNGPTLKSTIAALPTEISEALAPLDLNRRIYAIVRATGLTQADAYRTCVAHLDKDCEYSDESCQVCGSQLESESIVNYAISVVREWQNSEWTLRHGDAKEFIFSKLAEIAETAPVGIARQAAMDLARLHGMVTSKLEVKHVEQTPDDLLSELVGFFDALSSDAPQISAEIIDADLL